MAGRYTFRTKIRRTAAGIHPAAVLLPRKGERDLPSVSWADPSCFYVCSHEAISRIFASASPGPSMRIAPPKVNTHEKNGGVFCCEINGIEPSKSGAAGELRGTISYEKRLGSIYANNKLGTYGTLNKLPSFCKDSIAVADISEVTPGNAEIYCTLDDGKRNAYKIEIIKAVKQSAKDDKGIVFRVTDKDLLAKTCGIVQGMSGSPIVQNGKLVGAVTHVFVNDPTKGYGVYAKWMLTN